MYSDSIAAISTPPGRGGVAIVRLSGADALAIAEKMFIPAGRTAVRDFEPYRLYPGSADCGSFRDFGMCVYFKAPHSFTGENVVEFHCHGGTAIARGILKRAVSLGARLAERGEFTKRAFLNGKAHGQPALCGAAHQNGARLAGKFDRDPCGHRCGYRLPRRGHRTYRFKGRARKNRRDRGKTFRACRHLRHGQTGQGRRCGRACGQAEFGKKFPAQRAARRG